MLNFEEKSEIEDWKIGVSPQIEAQCLVLFILLTFKDFIQYLSYLTKNLLWINVLEMVQALLLFGLSLSFPSPSKAGYYYYYEMRAGWFNQVSPRLFQI